MTFYGNSTGLLPQGSNNTWDPGAISTGIVLSNGNLTATHNGGSNQYLQIFAKTTHNYYGSYYCEFTFRGITLTNDTAFGIVDPSGSLTVGNWIGSDTHSLGEYLNPSGIFSQTSASNLNYNFGLNPYSSLLSFYVTIDPNISSNNVATFDINYTNPPIGRGNNFLLALTGRPNFRVAATLFEVGSSVTVNFGQSPYIYPPPVGFSNW